MRLTLAGRNRVLLIVAARLPRLPVLASRAPCTSSLVQLAPQRHRRHKCSPAPIHRRQRRPLRCPLLSAALSTFCQSLPPLPTPRGQLPSAAPDRVWRRLSLAAPRVIFRGSSALHAAMPANALTKMPSGLALPIALVFLTPSLVLLTLVRRSESFGRSRSQGIAPRFRLRRLF